VRRSTIRSNIFERENYTMSAEVQIKCRNIWKIFGDNPKRFMKRHNGAPTPEALTEAGYIGACHV